MQRLIKITMCLLISGFCSAQTNFTEEQQQIYNVVLQVFDGMRAGDSAMVSNSFLSDAQMYTATKDRDGNPVLHKGSLSKFLEAVGTPHEQVWNEPIWNTEIKIDGKLAQVWTDYAFYAGQSLSHCGVDAFQLFKSADGWKIFVLTDTRNRDNCDLPDDIENKQN